jgi:hypothetical protein
MTRPLLLAALEAAIAGALCLMALPAHAESVEWDDANRFLTSPPSIGTLQATTEPGAVAELVFQNRNVNGPNDAGSVTVMAHEGLSVSVRFLWSSSGADTLVIEPPEGFVAVPRELTVEEGEDGVSFIYPDQHLLGF